MDVATHLMSYASFILFPWRSGLYQHCFLLVKGEKGGFTLTPQENPLNITTPLECMNFKCLILNAVLEYIISKKRRLCTYEGCCDKFLSPRNPAMLKFIAWMYSSPWKCPQSYVAIMLFFSYFISPVHISATGDSFRLMDWLSACHLRFVIPLRKSLRAQVPLSPVQSGESFCTICPYEATTKRIEAQSESR